MTWGGCIHAKTVSAINAGWPEKSWHQHSGLSLVEFLPVWAPNYWRKFCRYTTQALDEVPHSGTRRGSHGVHCVSCCVSCDSGLIDPIIWSPAASMCRVRHLTSYQDNLVPIPKSNEVTCTSFGKQFRQLGTICIVPQSERSPDQLIRWPVTGIHLAWYLGDLRN